MPPIGMNPNVWQSYALYGFAAVVSLQPFSNDYGTQLAGM